MRWEERLLELFDDLEQQAEGLALAGRDAEVAELSRAEYARVDLAARLHASVGRSVRLAVTGLGLVQARLAGVGDGWCLLSNGTAEWLVRTPAIRSARGLSPQSRPPLARPVTARLGLPSALRGVAEAGSGVVVHHLDGTCEPGRLARVGADFVELTDGDETVPAVGGVEVVPLDSLAAVRTSTR